MLSRRVRGRAATPDSPVVTGPIDFNQGIGDENALLPRGSPFQQQLQVADAGLAALAGSTAPQRGPG